MKSTKKNLGGLGFLLPAKNIETVKEEKEHESSSIKQHNDSAYDSQVGDYQSSGKGLTETDNSLKGRYPTLSQYSLNFIQHSSKNLYK